MTEADRQAVLQKVEFVMIYNNVRLDKTARSKDLVVEESIVNTFPINPKIKQEFTS